MTSVEPRAIRSFPWSSGVLFGLGLGGFFDGIVLHQILQWHHMLSSWYPITSIENLELNTFWDGIFHSATYVVVLFALFVLWRAARLDHFRWSTRTLISTMLIGFGTFNLVEGIVDHQLLAIHHVIETVGPRHWLYWDMGFLLWGASMIILGTWIGRRSRA